MKHGTVWGYRHGCPCWACVDAGRSYHRERTRRRALAKGHVVADRPNTYGERTRVDAGRLKRLIDATGTPIHRVSRSAGLGPRTLDMVLKHEGRCSLATLGRICTYFDIDERDIEVTP